MTGDTLFVRRARELRPVLRHREAYPKRRVAPCPDATLYQGWRAREQSGSLLGDTLRTGDAICWDFGEHIVGHVFLRLSLAGARQDSPLKIRLTFGEAPNELIQSAADYTGWLSAAWLQEETILIDALPCEITLPRRYAFRYVRLEICAASMRFGARVEALQCDATTSAEAEKVREAGGLFILGGRYTTHRFTPCAIACR